MEAVNTDRRICMKFLSDIAVRHSFRVQRSNLYLLAILQPFYYFLNLLLLVTSHTESKANIMTFSNECKFSFKLYSGEILLQLRPNSAVTDKRLSSLFLLYATAGRPARCESSTTRVLPYIFCPHDIFLPIYHSQSRWDWSKHPCGWFSSYDPLWKL